VLAVRTSPRGCRQQLLFALPCHRESLPTLIIRSGILRRWRYGQCRSRSRFLPFDDPNFVFELKYDGFRALAVAERRPELVSRNGHPFGSFANLAKQIAEHLPPNTVIDGEIAGVDRKGKPRFNDLLFHRRPPCFFAFDVLMLEGRDCRTHQLAERKQELRRLLAQVPLNCPLRYVYHVDGSGVALFERVCKLDLEGVVAKHKHAPYVEVREQSTWIKILNPRYSQKVGREELFERDRQEPVPGWHSCVAVCSSAAR
jgi:ATP-dependent DNA ligase